MLGKFFGFVENFHGIGVVVDTYDNDGTGLKFEFIVNTFSLKMASLGQHPMINLLRNTGEKAYEHHHEGGQHHGGDMELGKMFSLIPLLSHSPFLSRSL